jgi:hypothetical protein
MTWGIDSENLILCSATWAAEQDRLGFIHETTTTHLVARAAAQTKRASAGGSLGRGPGIVRAGRNNPSLTAFWFKSAICNTVSNKQVSLSGHSAFRLSVNLVPDNRRAHRAARRNRHAQVRRPILRYPLTRWSSILLATSSQMSANSRNSFLAKESSFFAASSRYLEAWSRK